MNAAAKTKEALMFNAMLLFFIIHENQLGVGVLGLPRIIFMESGHDAWISALFSGVLVSIEVWIVISILKIFSDKDLYDIHVIVFGKWIGNLFNFLFICCLLGIFFIIVINYIEVVQVWVFPKISTWFLAILLLFLAGYGTLGGIRVIVGIAFITMIFTYWMFLVLYTPVKFIDYTHFQPIFTATPKEMIMGVYKTSFSVFGFEVLFFLWPYIKEKQKALKFALMGVLFTTLNLALVTFISIGFFSEEGLKKTVWPLLSMFKIVRIPNLERFEIIAISFWMLIILPNLCLYLWSATKGLKKVFKLSQRKNIWIVCILIWLLTFFIDSRVTASKIADYVSEVGFYFIFVYPIFLLVFVTIRKKMKKKGSV